MIIVSDLQELRQLDELTVDWCNISVVIGLFKNNLTPDRDTVDGDFTEADYTGYMRGDPCDWSSARTDGDHRAYSVSQCLQFSGTGADQIVYGWYALEPGGQTYFCERFDEPITLGSAWPALCFQIRYTLSQRGEVA